MGWLSRIFNKKKKMDLKEKTLPEVKEELSKYDFQWIKGDKMGNVEKFLDVSPDEATGMTFVEFKGGGRINVELLEEYLDKFPATKVDFKDEPVITEPSLEQSIQGNNLPSTYDKQASRNTVSSVQLEESPIYKLLKKQKENWVNVNITLKLNLPPKSLYNVLISSFDNADDEIINYITEGIDIEDIRSALADSISNYYDATQKSTSKSLKKNKEKPIEEDGDQ
jgi:hypothetical protein